MSDTPRPPAGSGNGWAPPPTPGAAPDAVVVPAWLASDWLLALRVAGVGLGLLVLGGVVLTVLTLLGQVAGGGLDLVDWGATALSPFGYVLGWFGAYSGDPLLLTGVLYAFLAYRVAARTGRGAVQQVTGDRTRTVALAGKVGAVTAGLLLVTAIVVEALVSGSSAVGSRFGGSSMDLTTLVFFSLLAGAAIALVALLSAARTTLVRLLQIRVATPHVVRIGWSGARRTLLIGGAGLLLLATVGNLLDDLTDGQRGIGGILATLLFTVASLLQLWVDRALLLLLGTTKFLHEGGFAWSGFGGVAGWMWLAIPVLVAAYVAGGIQAAKVAGPRSQIEAARSALLVGPLVAAVTLLVAIGWAGQSGLRDIVPIALVLPTLWGVVAVGGAWLWGNQQGLASGVVVERPEAGPGGQQPSTGPRDLPPPEAGAPRPPESWPPPPPG